MEEDERNSSLLEFVKSFHGDKNEIFPKITAEQKRHEDIGTVILILEVVAALRRMQDL